ncbi:GFA family protein [Psychromarinibacter sp. C21-152]|uniref:GFA family protein n=1 Tax=Psychromarinibacter sediminicola TaxID=3033385 RepID=A0AAE3NW53_9RHOB|nr:GFA family protein [Psychromarinibacter sediminicola]MDF0603121.1 GFA family protein [Psychromarinibacter sediminicola]
MTGAARRLTCHCGAVELSVVIDRPLAEAKRCDCSFCRRRGAPMLGVPLDKLTVVTGADKLTLYTWGTGTAQHYFCSVCGIYTHHRRRSNPNEYGINLGALEGVNPRELGEFAWTDGVNHVSDRGR